jgi:hypothetical protein
MYQNSFTLLSAVTTATVGTAVNVERVPYLAFFVICTPNTGAVTITLEGSTDGTNYFTIDTTTLTSTTSSYYKEVTSNCFKQVRAKTVTQSNSTVTVTMRTSNYETEA